VSSGHRHHDMGGRPAGPVEASEHVLEPWEQTVEAMMWLLALPDRKVITIDQVRRAIEDMGPDVYDTLTYYERWISGLTQVLLETGTVTVSELGAELGPEAGPGAHAAARTTG
jgi:hypothetical protein